MGVPRVSRTVTIVGGGVHGVHLAVRLLDAGIVDHSQLRLVEPEGLLAQFRRQCEQCGTKSLRSPFVHHVGADPFSLRDYARSEGRLDEFSPSEFGADRPSVSLFFDHARHVREQYDLDAVVRDQRVRTVTDRGTHVDIETDAETFSTEWCLLAVGHGGSYRLPEWAVDLPKAPPVTHVWNPTFETSDVGEHASVGIVGGSITATQLATTLARPGRDVTVFSRSPLRVEQLEAGTEWMHFSGLSEKLHTHPPASHTRERIVEAARYAGAVSPAVARRFRRALDPETVTLEHAEVREVTPAGGTVVVTCEDGSATCVDLLVCATGFGSPYDGALFRRLRSESNLQTGYRGAPLLDDDTLRWQRTDGDWSRVFVSGAATQQVLGPFARNIVGAKRAGTLVTDELRRVAPAPTTAGVP